jgi:hypothetical protein
VKKICTFCGKGIHFERECWSKTPELKPQNFYNKRGAGRDRGHARGGGKFFLPKDKRKVETLMVTLNIVAIVAIVAFVMTMIMTVTMFMFPINKIKCI